MGKSYSYGEAIDLINRLQLEYGTHVHAAVNSWGWPMTIGEIDQRIATTAFLNVYRDRQQHSEPFDAEWPWNSVDAITPQERERYEKVLAANSAFGPDND
jgi:hypothetical protein